MRPQLHTRVVDFGGFRKSSLSHINPILWGNRNFSGGEKKGKKKREKREEREKLPIPVCTYALTFLGGYFFVDTDLRGFFFGAQCHTNVTHTNVFFMSSVCHLNVRRKNKINTSRS